MTIRVLPAVAAYAAKVQVGTLRQWVRRGHIPAPVGGLYDLVAVLEHAEQRPERDFHRAIAGRTRRGERRDLQSNP